MADAGMADEQSRESAAKEQAAICLKCGGRLFNYGFLGMPYQRCETCGAIWLDESLECDKCG